jgi:hypothetical protein
MLTEQWRDAMVSRQSELRLPREIECEKVNMIADY